MSDERGLAALRRQLLGSVSHLLALVPLNARFVTGTRGFQKSSYLANRFAFVEGPELQRAVEQFFSLIGVHDPAAAFELASRKVHRFQFQEFVARFPWITKKPGEDELGAAVRQFFAAQVLFGILPERFNEQHAYPPVVEEILHRGGEGLFTLGRAQFFELARIACSLVDWCVQRGFRNVTAVESPLGNTLPVQVLVEIARQRGLAIRAVEWGCPRNQAAVVGLTVKDSAKAFANNPLILQADCVLLLDDVLTGSRLLNMARALRRAVGSARFAAVAMRFRFGNGTGLPDFSRRDLSDIEIWAREQHLPFGFIDFPELPMFDVDSEGKAFLETALCWGDSDLVAGKRKVNLVFNIIDHYQAITQDLALPESEYLRWLKEVLWRRDDSGSVFVFGAGVVEGLLAGAFQKLPVDTLFARIRREAQRVFPDDYLGNGFAATCKETRRRSNWLKTCIFEASKAELGEQTAQCLSRAVTEIHEAGFDADKRSPTKSHSYGHYTIPWNATVRELNRTLRDLIVTSAPCLQPATERWSA